MGKLASSVPQRPSVQVKQLQDLTTPEIVELTARGKRLRGQALIEAIATRKRSMTGATVPRTLKFPALATNSNRNPAVGASADPPTPTQCGDASSSVN